MPDLEAKIASYASDKKEALKRVDKDRRAMANQEEESSSQQGIGGMMKGWFWRK